MLFRSFVNLDWSPDLQPASGVDQIAEEVGGSAVDIVVEQINKNESGIPHFPKTVLLTGKWVAGSTLLNLKEAPRSKPRSLASKKKTPARKSPVRRRVLQPAVA